MVSIIISSFNKKDCVVNQLEQLKKQRYPASNFEVIVCDDNSTDGTREAIKKIGLPYRLKIFNTNSPLNFHGLCRARNMGIKSASGEVLLFFDDDNLAHPECIERHLSAIKGKGVCVQGYRSSIPGDESKNLEDITMNPRFLHKLLRGCKGDLNNLKFSQVCVNNFSIRRDDVLKAGMFDEKFNKYGYKDSEFGYRLFLMGIKIKFDVDAVARHLDPNSTKGSEWMKQFGDDKTKLREWKDKQTLEMKKYFRNKYPNDKIIREYLK